MRRRPKYQVFVSSPYADLHAERAAVIWELMKLRLIPTGMESFTAADDRGWNTIKRVIDDSDYYVLLLAGMYGSVDGSTGISWTQREYEYAVERKIPVLAFIRERGSVPGDMVELDPSKRKLLEDFQNTVVGRHLYKAWRNREDLVAHVNSAVINHIHDDEDSSTPRPGWYRGDSLPSEGTLEELARLSAENSRLRELLSKYAEVPAPRLSFVRGAGETLEPTISDDRVRVVLDIAESRGRYWEAAGRSAADLAAFVDRSNRTAWLYLSILNSGQKAAEDVVVDFELHGVEELLLVEEELPKDLLGDDGSGFVLQRKLNPQAHVHIDEYSSDGLSLATARQRVRTIAPGASEYLIPLGAIAPFAQGNEDKVEFEVFMNAIAKDGARAEARFTVVINYTGERHITENEL